MISSSLLPGVYAASLTPIKDDGSCNCEALVHHCQELIRKGCQGVVLFGTTGEGSSFSVSEREQVIRDVLRLGLDPQKIIIGISCCAIEDAVKLASLAIDCQCAAVLIAPPFFYKNVSAEGVINFYKTIIRLVNRPELKILLYHIPKYSGVPITLNIINALKKEYPHIVIGIKDSDGDFAFTKEILSKMGDFKLFVGHELHISEAAQLGAAGGISGMVNAFPELICSLYDAPDSNSRVEKIIESIKKFPLFPAIKGIVEEQKGREWHDLRPPLVPLNSQQKQALVESLKRSNDWVFG